MTADTMAKLGSPIRTEPLHPDDPEGVISYANATTGVTLFGTVAQGIGIIMVSRRDAGRLAGIRVGDSYRNVTARWGPPAAGGQTEALWLAGPYVVTVRFNASGIVDRLGMGVGQQSDTSPPSPPLQPTGSAGG